jgi:hypothetical protein
VTTTTTATIAGNTLASTLGRRYLASRPFLGVREHRCTVTI